MAVYAGVDTFWQAKRGIVQDGLVLNLDAGVRESYNGGDTWYDLSGNGNNGTLMNGPIFSGDNGGNIVFDGTDDYTTGGDVSISGNACSIALWWIATGPPSTNNDSYGATIFAQSNNLYVGIFISNSWTNQRINFGVVVNDTISSPDNSVINNTINYAVGTCDGSFQKIYINGNLSASRSYSSNIQVANPAYRVGNWGYSSYQRNLQGKIYSVSLYNRALSANEVQQNFNVTRKRFGI